MSESAAPPGSPGAGRPLVVLVGPMGSGKSTVGALLATAYGVTARDTDTDVESSEGRSISDIFVESGEERFRALERAAVATALSEHDGVLSLGGGAVLDASTRDLLSGHRVVFLSVGLGDAVKRVGLGAGRPLLFGNMRAQVKKLLDERAPIYASVATLTVNTDETAPEDVVARIREGLEQTHE